MRRFLNFKMNWYKKAQQLNIPSILYHSTFKNNIESIKQRGLVPSFDGIVKCWPECKNGVYLHSDPDVAYSYAEIADNPNIPEEWFEAENNIVILEINTTTLNKNLFEIDPNLPSEQIGSYLYNGTIPSNTIIRII